MSVSLNLALPTHRRPRDQKWKTPRCLPALESLEDRCVPAVDPILEWNSVMLQANAIDHSRAPEPPIAPEQAGPILTGRAFAIVSVAMFDAYNSIVRRYTPYLTMAPGTFFASPDAAVAKAARDTLTALYPSMTALFDSALTQTLRRVPDGLYENRGVAVGRFVAQRILAARANDGGASLDDIQNPPYVPSGLPGFHDVDPLHSTQPFYGPDAGSVTPFAIPSTSPFAPGHLGAEGTGSEFTDIAAFLQTEEYAAAYAEVQALGGDGVRTPTKRTPEQTEIGIYWGYDGTPGLGTPPRLYNQIAQAVAIQQGNSVAENARMFALLNLAQSDAGCVSWEAKYEEQFWRPILGLRRGDEDGNPMTVGDPAWSPLGAPASNPYPGQTNFTPPFPAYTSGHATFGAAVFRTLERFYRTDDIRFTFVSDEFNGLTRDQDGSPRPIRPRTFNSFSQAAAENGQSRIYLGIHWAFDRDEGIRTGRNVADYVYENFLRPRGGAAPGGGDAEFGGDEVRALTEGRREARLPSGSGADALALEWQVGETGDDPAFVLLAPEGANGDASDRVSVQTTAVRAEPLLAVQTDIPTAVVQAHWSGL